MHVPPWYRLADIEREWWDGLAGDLADAKAERDWNAALAALKENARLLERMATAADTSGLDADERRKLNELLTGVADRDLAAQLAEANRKVLHLERERDEAQNNVRLGQSRIAEREAELKTASATYCRELDKKDADLWQAERLLDEVKDERDKTRDQLAGARAHRADAVQRLDEAKDDLAKAKAEISEINADVEVVKGERDRLRDDVTVERNLKQAAQAARTRERTELMAELAEVKAERDKNAADLLAQRNLTDEIKGRLHKIATHVAAAADVMDTRFL